MNNNQDKSRLIEHAFPLKQASLDSVHEKNVRHGHISTLHIWPAWRPLAACRAALIATLLPDPGDPKKRQELCEKIGGRVVEKIEKKKMPNGKIVENIKEVTEGGILHWKRETENKETLDWFREEIKKAYGGRAPKVLDPFAGGGAIPLEAMRLGCEVTAMDINPVAWFILKCTLEYPQKLAGKKLPLPDFILKDQEFMEKYFKSLGFKGKQLRTQMNRMGFGEDQEPELTGFETHDVSLEADLAWHVRAWGKWVLNQARKDLAKYYPTYADFEALKPSHKKCKKREMKLVPLKEDGNPDIDDLNTEFDESYLNDETNPRWVAKLTVAYLWARTVKCKNCRATIPLLKTQWLCKKAKKRVLLTMELNEEKTGVTFGIQNDVPVKGVNTAQRREHDKMIGAGTMSRSGATCPCCKTIMKMEDIRFEGQAGRLSAIMTSVVFDGKKTKEYRDPFKEEIKLVPEAEMKIEDVFQGIPFGLPKENLPSMGALGFSIPSYGFDKWYKLFTPRQLVSLGTFVKYTQSLLNKLLKSSYPIGWTEAIVAELSIAIDKLADRQSALCRWDVGYSKISNTFTRFALPILWDYCEGNPLSDTTGNYLSCVEWVAEVINHVSEFPENTPFPRLLCESAINDREMLFDIVLTDPPYYDAIPYSNLMDFFYIWLRRSLHGLSDELDHNFFNTLGPKWDHEKSDGELIDDSERFEGNKIKSKEAYENGMYRAFQACYKQLKPEGKLVIVFAHKHPDAWETLVSAIIRAGFVVDGSWPIQTEMGNRTRALASAALSSSVWLICRKRHDSSKSGWDNKVLEEMRDNIAESLHEFWDAGIRGPDFVWAATGPAMEAYSKHPVVKKANKPGEVMKVSEFLRHVRRMVVDFVVGRVLSPSGGTQEISGLDDVTTYYLLHRHDFGLEDASAGPCILYAVSCGLSDKALADQFDILARTGGKSGAVEEGKEANEEVGGGTGSTLKLKKWHQRKRPNMGYDPAIDSAKARADSLQLKMDIFPDEEKPINRREIPLIDQIHRLMHLWKAGELSKVNDYLDTRVLLRNNTFHQVLQALIELSAAGSEERSILESISNHLKSRGVTVREKQKTMFEG